MSSKNKKEIWVIKAGGELLNIPSVRRRLLNDLKSLSRSRKIIFIHGGGPQIEQELIKNKIPVKFKNGRRVTTPEAMIIVERVLSGEINKGLVGDLNRLKIQAVGLSGRDSGMILGQPIPGLGHAARPMKISVKFLHFLVDGGYLPVVSTVASDFKGNAVNINADDVASAIAIQVKADHLVFLTNISGVLDSRKKRIPVLKTAVAKKLIQSGVITGGMIPKVQSACLGIQKGIQEIDILNGKIGLSLKNGTRILK